MSVVLITLATLAEIDWCENEKPVCKNRRFVEHFTFSTQITKINDILFVAGFAQIKADDSQEEVTTETVDVNLGSFKEASRTGTYTTPSLIYSKSTLPSSNTYIHIYSIGITRKR